MVPFIGVVYEGKWFVKRLGPHWQVLSEAYQPETDNWYPIYDGMVLVHMASLGFMGNNSEVKDYSLCLEVAELYRNGSH